MEKCSKKFPIGLAPMEGVTEYPARIWFHLFSNPDFLCTPFLRMTDTFPAKKWPNDFAPELTAGVGAPYELWPQMMASSVENFLKGWEQIHRQTGGTIASVDINCGCPSPNPTGRGAGSSLLKHVDEFSSMIEQLTRAMGPGVLGVKMRTGFHDTDQYSDLIEGIKDQPLARLTIHGRTRSQKYRDYADWTLIQEAAEKVPYTVFGSGDISNYGTLIERQKTAPDVGGVIIGRGGLRNPKVFDDIRFGTAQSIDRTELQVALVAYGLLHELWHTARPEMIEQSRDYWARPLDEIITHIEARLGQKWQDVSFSRYALGRTKMLWSSWRSSFPETFFAPKTMRAKSLKEFIELIDLQFEEPNPRITLTYQSSLNWIYSGQKKPDISGETKYNGPTSPAEPAPASTIG
jgi:tRNA-dihydrouridine synthase